VDLNNLSPKNGGLWDVENIKVRYIDDNLVQFSCEHKVLNGETETRIIGYTLLDRIRGVDFDSKVRRELAKFIAEMESRNDKIRSLREKNAKLDRLTKALTYNGKENH